MDHVWQIGHIGPPEHEMLEAYTALGWLAAKTERVKLLDHGHRRSSTVSPACWPRR